MKNSLLGAEVVEPYAEALMSLADSQGKVENFGEDARGLLAALDESGDLRQVLANPAISTEDKKSVLRRIGETSRLQPLVVNFLLLLADKNRLMFLAEICQQFLALLRQRQQIVLAEVTAARELERSQREDIAARVKSITGARDVELQVEVDPELLGGVVIRVGSQVLDASLRGQLRRLSLQLAP